MRRCLFFNKLHYIFRIGQFLRKGGAEMNTIIILLVSLFLVLPAQSQVKEKIDELHEKCRLVRGHAYTVQQIIEDDKYSEVVVRAHHRLIDTNLRDMEFLLREIETLLTNQQKSRVNREMEQLHNICNDTKPMVASILEELDSEDTNVQRLRILASRIYRNLKTAMEIKDTMASKL